MKYFIFISLLTLFPSFAEDSWGCDSICEAKMREYRRERAKRELRERIRERNERVASETPEPSKEKVDNLLNTIGTRSAIDLNGRECWPL